jgi:MFS family permease
VTTAARRASERLGTLGSFLRNESIRRLEFALAGSLVADWAFAVALGVVAFRAGGATAVGVAGLVRLLPAAVASPFTGLLADRFPRERVMFVSLVARAAVQAVAVAAVTADAPDWWIYSLPALDGLAGIAFRPAQAAALPSLARSPAELTAANVAASTIESVAFFAGPGLAGILLAFTDTRSVFVVSGALFLWAALLVFRIRREAEAPARLQGRVRADLLAGARTIVEEGRLRLLVGLYTAQTFVAGAVNALTVIAALELLQMGESGVGFLNAAVGVGGIVGGAAALLLLGRRRVAAGFGLGALLWGVPVVLVGVWPEAVVALILFGILGIGNTVVDVAAITLLQRGVRDEVLARVFGVLEGLLVAGLALGSAAAPLLTGGLGVRGALIATGAVLPVLVALSWRRLASIDVAPEAAPGALELLRGVPMLAPLPAATFGELASRLTTVTVESEDVLFRRGDPGDLFYVVERGEVEIDVEGKPPVRAGPGDYFGELALLRDFPRTGTATARTSASLFALDGPTFVAAVTGHPGSAKAAAAVISSRLGSLRPGLASI